MGKIKTFILACTLSTTAIAGTNISTGIGSQNDIKTQDNDVYNTPTADGGNGYGYGGNATSNGSNSTINIEGDNIRFRRNPANTAYAPALTAYNCLGSVSFGGQGATFGFTAGKTVLDEGCDRIRKANWWYNQGETLVAREIMLLDRDTAKAYYNVYGYDVYARNDRKSCMYPTQRNCD